MNKPLKPGQLAPNSGEYEIRGPRGGATGQERTAIQGRPLPPTPKTRPELHAASASPQWCGEETVTVSADKTVELWVKHLEMVQGVATRLANYGATLKNYCLTLTTAVCGFAITLHRPLVALLALVPILIFAVLDAQYLRVERRFGACSTS